MREQENKKAFELQGCLTSSTSHVWFPFETKTNMHATFQDVLFFLFFFTKQNRLLSAFLIWKQQGAIWTKLDEYSSLSFPLKVDQKGKAKKAAQRRGWSHRRRATECLYNHYCEGNKEQLHVWNSEVNCMPSVGFKISDSICTEKGRLSSKNKIRLKMLANRPDQISTQRELVAHFTNIYIGFIYYTFQICIRIFF